MLVLYTERQKNRKEKAWPFLPFFSFLKKKLMRILTAVTNRILPLEEAVSIPHKAFSESLSASASSAADSAETSPWDVGDDDEWEETTSFPALSKWSCNSVVWDSPMQTPRAGFLPAGTVPSSLAPRGAGLSWPCPCAVSQCPPPGLGLSGRGLGVKNSLSRGHVFLLGDSDPQQSCQKALGSATETSPTYCWWTIGIVFSQCDKRPRSSACACFCMC